MKRYFLTLVLMSTLVGLLPTQSNASDSVNIAQNINLQNPTSCRGAPPIRLQVGQRGRVIDDLPNNVRSSPRLSAPKIGEIPPSNLTFHVVDGPQCSDGLAYWQVYYEYEDLLGWTAEGQYDEYWLDPVFYKRNIPVLSNSRRTPPNGLAGLSVGGGGGGTPWGGDDIACYSDAGRDLIFKVSSGISAYYDDIEIGNGDTVSLPITAISLYSTSLPHICIADNLDSNSSYAISADGIRYDAVSSFLPGFMSDNTMVSLPYEAYNIPGRWTLYANDYSIDILVPAFEETIYEIFVDGFPIIWGFGFDSYEEILIVTGLYGNTGQLYWEYTVNADSSGSFQFYVPHSLGGFFIISNSGHFANYGFGIGRSSELPSNIVDIYLNRENNVSHSDGSIPSCSGYLTPQLSIGEQAYIIDLNGESNALNSLPKRPSANPESQQLGAIPAGGVFTVLDGPVCGDGNIVWWYVNYNGTLGWTGEGQGNTYWAAQN